MRMQSGIYLLLAPPVRLGGRVETAAKSGGLCALEGLVT